MRTDITIENKVEESQLIIDTKFYLSALRSNYRGEGKKHVSHNLYQIFAYINNSEFEGVKRGMLLYPTVEIEIDSVYWINGKKIEVKTVNLDEEWDRIEERLLSIIN
jgi:5-methylcytosine-specific restriction enzyme subunit McrC